MPFECFLVRMLYSLAIRLRLMFVGGEHFLSFQPSDISMRCSPQRYLAFAPRRYRFEIMRIVRVLPL